LPPATNEIAALAATIHKSGGGGEEIGEGCPALIPLKGGRGKP